MMMRRLLSLLLLFTLLPCRHAHAVEYEAIDSVRVEMLLREANNLPVDSSLMLFFARQFLDVPYVAHTLEHADGRERLVVNLRQMDCTTLVETTAALALTATSGSCRWADYCACLQKLRYIDGVMDGYASRCHYFSQWIVSGCRQGLVTEVASDGHFPFTASRATDLHYMSRHRDAYPAMAHDMGETKRVARYERLFSGAKANYMPASLTGLTASELSCIHDGDILALVTKKDGLDVSHLGIAVWGADGMLHLLNASSLYHKVVLDSEPLYRYLQKHPASVGIRVVRVNCR